MFYLGFSKYLLKRMKGRNLEDFWVFGWSRTFMLGVNRRDVEEGDDMFICGLLWDVYVVFRRVKL